MTIKICIKKFNKKITKSNFVTDIISSILYLYTRLVYKTSNWEVIGREKAVELWENNNGFILIGWHGRALMMPPFHDFRYPINALVSLHKDGRLIAGVLEKYGIGTIGGSTNNNARGAALSLMSSLQDNTSICIIPDGPRGPRMHLSMSPIYYAQKTGKPIVGMAYSTKKNKIIESAWDKMMIPYPFNDGICIFSDPIYIPPTANDETLEKHRQQIENQLNEINFIADRKMGMTPIQPGKKIKSKKDNKGK